MPDSAAEAELRLLAEIQSRRECRRSFLAWCKVALKPFGQVPAAHHRLMCSELQDVSEGVTSRLMIFMPPGHGKSRYASTLFPPWFLSRMPGQDVIGASYNAELVEDFSLQAIRLVREHHKILGYDLADESRKLWHTTNGGSYRAAGVGGGVTGRRANLVVIDDPIRGREDADSETLRNKVWSWYRAEVVTRLKPRAGIVLIQTRWHEDDLAGRLLGDAAEQWRIINLPALCETDDDPLGRDAGDALWPDWEDADALARKRVEVGEREWASLFQQRPRPLEGNLFKQDMIEIVDAAPSGGMVARAWDLAATSQTGARDPDWTVGVLLRRAPSGQFYVLDVVRIRGGPDQVEAVICATARADGPHVRISLPQDPGQAGKSQVLYFTRKLSGFIVETSPETGDKATRAAPVASQCNVGNLSIVRARWNSAFLDELGGFPSGTHDDQVDALSRAFAMVGMGRPPITISPEAMAASMMRW